MPPKGDRKDVVQNGVASALHIHNYIKFILKNNLRDEPASRMI